MIKDALPAVSALALGSGMLVAGPVVRADQPRQSRGSPILLLRVGGEVARPLS
jgi:hypothetical protein